MSPRTARSRRRVDRPQLVGSNRTVVGGLKIVQVKGGQEAEFERLFAELRAIRRTDEPGCILYSLLRSRTKAGAYIVHEQYRDQAALDAHQKTTYGADYFPRMRAVIETITVEYFDGAVP
jgi:quinol monooxygenase YgiN